MSKAVLLSIHPKYCELIASGEKTIELRKTRPKLETPFKCYIYETKGKTDIPTFVDEDGHYIYEGRGQVIGEFVCDEIQVFHYGIQTPEDARSWQDCYKGYSEDLYFMDGTMLSGKEIDDYGAGKFILAWNISSLVIYDKPKELSEFLKPCPHGDVSCFLCDKSGYNEDMHIDCFNKLTRAPQSWCYVEV